MANDGSMASKVEAWIVTTLEALPAFTDRNVEVFTGTLSAGGQQLLDEFENKGPLYLAVVFEGDVPRPTEEGDQDYEPTYAIFAVVSNKRAAGNARTGDVEMIGTNGIRDLLRTALHDKTPTPDIIAGGYHADRTRFGGTRVVFQRADLFILKATMTVREAPAP